MKKKTPVTNCHNGEREQYRQNFLSREGRSIVIGQNFLSRWTKSSVVVWAWAVGRFTE
jgi:hypothetical protein